MSKVINFSQIKKNISECDISEGALVQNHLQAPPVLAEIPGNYLSNAKKSWKILERITADKPEILPAVKKEIFEEVTGIDLMNAIDPVWPNKNEEATIDSEETNFFQIDTTASIESGSEDTLKTRYMNERNIYDETIKIKRDEINKTNALKWEPLKTIHGNSIKNLVPHSSDPAALTRQKIIQATHNAQDLSSIVSEKYQKQYELYCQMGIFPDFKRWKHDLDNEKLISKRLKEDRMEIDAKYSKIKEELLHDIKAYTYKETKKGVSFFPKEKAWWNTKVSFVDSGDKIKINDKHNAGAILAALQLATQKWGPLTLKGSDEYKTLCVKLAVRHGFQIKNPELQDMIHAEQKLQGIKPDEYNKNIEQMAPNVSLSLPPISKDDEKKTVGPTSRMSNKLEFDDAMRRHHDKMFLKM